MARLSCVNNLTTKNFILIGAPNCVSPSFPVLIVANELRSITWQCNESFIPATMTDPPINSICELNDEWNPPVECIIEVPVTGILAIP